MSFLTKINPLSRESVTLLLHVDVGEGNCRAALLTHNPETKRPEMLYTPAPYEKVSKGAHSKDLSVTLSSLRVILQEVTAFISKFGHTGRHLRVDQIYVILAAPYYLSHTALLKYKDKKEFTVTPELVSNLLHGYKKGNDPEYGSHTEVEIGGSPVTVSEKILHIKVNGYDTAKPYGRKAEAVDLSVFKTEVSEDVVSGIEKELRKYYKTKITYEPLSLAAYVAIRDRIHFEPNFLLLIVGNEVTELSLVRDFTLLETVSFPMGKHSLVRHLARLSKTPEDMMSGALTMYAQNQMHPEEKAKMEEAVKSGGGEWFNFFEKALVSLSDQSAVPNFVYLISDADVQPVFETFIETDSFGNQSLVPQGFDVTPVDPELAKSLMTFGPNASCDTILCLEGLFAISTKLPIPTIEN